MIATYYPEQNTTLAQYIEIIWADSTPHQAASHWHHAPLFTELIFNYEGAFKMEGDLIINTHSSSHQTLLSGLKKSPFKTKLSGNYINIGFIMKPHCYSLIKQHLNTPLLHQIAEALYDHFFNQPTIDSWFLQQLLKPLFSSKNIPTPVSNLAFHLSNSIEEKKRIQTLESHTISNKHLISLFKKTYGITPNQFLQLQRVNQAITIQSQKNTKNLAALALEVGFFDQSHFIRTFKKFCGETPQKFFQRNIG
ncbi:helix-turn-helix domain-containing protein [Halosquirtibacter laminarini]|uniref:Helix-turn-helix domain-containing protein n=1 Tax=Halosquirtibacter laminarini TaxID=3374600 RepID=A0AC61NP22_9BACT|nr:helix-turn-helix domain-containing protein [Prolixibacteraceae bacterium]